MSNLAALVIGSSGGLAQALIKKLVADSDYSAVHAVSRGPKPQAMGDVFWHQLDSAQEKDVKHLAEELKEQYRFSIIVCCVGVLHDEHPTATLKPEKRLEDIDPEALLNYFHTNTVIPALWLKYGVHLLNGKHTAKMVFFSARVGSIEDNRLGGWYGYRASKSALNMMIKTAQVEYKRRAPNVSLVSYHPGTVDTALSRPFQRNVAENKLFTAEFSVSQLLSLLPTLSSEHDPHYIDWQGQSIPW